MAVINGARSTEQIKKTVKAGYFSILKVSSLPRFPQRVRQLTHVLSIVYVDLEPSRHCLCAKVPSR